MDGDGFSRQYRINLDRLSTLPPTGGLGPDDTGGVSTLPPVSSTLPPVSLYPPMGGRQPVIEPSIEPSVKQCADGAIDPEGLPEWLDQDLWASYVRSYHDLQNMKGKTVPDAWEAKALRILSDLVAQGEDPTEVLQRAINSDFGLLLSTRNPNISNPANSGHHHGHTGHPAH